MVIIESGEEVDQSKKTRKRRRLEDVGPSSNPKEVEEDEDVRKGHFVYKIGDNLTERSSVKILLLKIELLRLLPSSPYADEIKSLLDEGTFCRVLECWDSQKEDYVAIKVIHNKDMFRSHREAEYEITILQILAENDEGNLHFVQMQNCFSYQKHPCIVFEKLGPSLFHFQKKNKNCPLPVDLVREFASQLLESVAYLHELGVIHADMKPQNILLVHDLEEIPGCDKTSDAISLRFMPKSNAIKLIDFGCAVTESPISNAIINTRPYRAPEVILVLGWSYPCDIWSIGCTLLKFCLGVALFLVDEDSEHLAMMARVLGPLPEHTMRTAQDKFQALPDTEAVRELDSLQNLISRRGRPSSSSLVGLLQALLKFDPSERLTARKALDHKFFKDQT